jgi:nucleotide-binding universal stress UspA family protein
MPHRNIFKKILFCTDFSENADRAFRYAVNVAAGNPESELIIFHIIPEADAQFWRTYLYEVDQVDEKARGDIETKIKETYTSRLPAGIAHSVQLAVGRVDQTILKAAGETGADLIVIGRRGSSGVGTIFYGKTTEHIARKAHCPVLIVPDDTPPEPRAV